MTINLIGGTGQLGRRVVAQLIEQGASPRDIIVTGRDPERAEGMFVEGVTVRRGDYDDPESLMTAFEGSDVVLLIASLDAPEHRVGQHMNALRAARANGVKRVVFISFATADPESKFEIAPFLLFAETATRQSGMEWTILRDGVYLDPVAEWVPDLVEMGELPYPVRHGRVAYISRDDLARAVAAALIQPGHEGKVYDLTGRDAITMDELARAISVATGRDVPFRSISDEEYAEICRRDGIPEPFIRVLTSMYWAIDAGEVEKGTDHVEVLTGTPPESAEDYLRRTVEL
ncbi:MAG: SDR family oxidoreductase [Thermoplasmata archaeon]|nr:MAG: SDR family oxidoreductase [Thermoplasmata archaeon]